MNPSFRDQFPILKRMHNNNPLVFLDGPAGTQVPEIVINAISDYYKTSNANTHGAFITTHETDEMLSAIRAKLAVFLNAESPDTISFGQNMTSLNFKLSRAFSRILQPGDEVLITQLDHEANRGPWLSLRNHGIIVREVNITKDGKLNYTDFEEKINERTRLVAMGYASNIFGTVNDVKKIRSLTYRYGSLLLLDAVHYAPHLPIDVQAIGCDFLLCSAYKFYGPHVGILYSKTGQLDSLPTDRLRTADQMAPYRIETGTLNHAAISGIGAAVEFMSNFHQSKDPFSRAKLLNSIAYLHNHEISLAKKLVEGLSDISKIQIIGPSFENDERAPTLSFTYEGKTSLEVCQFLAKHGICGWDGHFYAIRATEVLGLLEKGGVTRLGIAAYNTLREVDYTIEALKKLN